VIEQAIILGNHIQGLGVARICKALGLKVVLYNDSSICLTRFSNSCNTFKLFDNEFALKEQLMHLKLQPKTALLLPTNDKMVGFMATNYELLNTKFALSIPPPEITDISYNKIKTYQTAKEMGIPHPESFFPKNEDDLKQITTDFPVIIKPAVMHKFYHQVGKKVFLCNNREELLENYRKAVQVIVPEEIIVQEFLDGGAKNLYSFGSFCDGQKVWGSFVANRIRQKPMNFGIATTFAKTVVNERIDKLAKKLLTGIGYFGLSETEFMYDQKTDDFKLIEINPRTWKWHTITNKLGINLMEMMIHHLHNQEIAEQHNKLANVGWIERVTDTYIALSEILKGKMSVSEYLNSLKMPKESACFSREDPLPGLMYLLLVPYLYFKR
jgi:predicted ATP-grasp superfamily ATP-dependent carboligase